MTAELKYPVGIQTFEKLRNGNYLYVDKTKYIKELISGGSFFFLSRPRRFGKSLLLSMLACYFEGKRELFKGLAADSDNLDWTPRPVIKLSLSSLDAGDANALNQLLDNSLRLYEEIYGSQLRIDAPSQRFYNLIRNAYLKTGQKVAVLVDEYDAPLLNTHDNEDINTSYRKTLKSLFTVLKDADEYIHFAFITGISRFSHTSLFSGANNLKDISLRDEYAAICGITEEELKGSLVPGIDAFAEKLSISSDEMLSMLKENYDGYHFSAVCPDIYNPFSLLNALDAKKISNYWFRSGTSTFGLYDKRGPKKR